MSARQKSETRNSKSQWSAFTLVELLVVIAIIGVLVALLLPAVQAAREAARRMTCTNHLKQFGLAVHNYHDAFKVLPVSVGWVGQNLNGKGWIVSTLPFLEQQSLYDQFKPYLKGNMSAGSGILDPGCRAALRTALPVFRCPSDGLTPNATSTVQFQVSPYETALTWYKGSAGTSLNCRYTPDCDGLFWFSTYLRPIKFSRITDGLSRTLMIGEEVPMQNNHSAVYYANGDYLTTEHPLNTLFDPAIPNLPDFVVGFRSMHAGGVQFCLADGSVHFIDEGIGHSVYQALSTKAGNESLSSSW